MREWNLKPGDPLSLTLAADARLCPTDYTDDQIWELSLGGGEPPALALQTTYGLRARALRLFPRFAEGDVTVSDPAEFSRTPSIIRNYPNFIELTFSPLPDIDVVAEYWVPQSHSIAGRIKVTNHSNYPRLLRLEWVGLLTPTEGQRMAPAEMQAALTLSGQTDSLAPVVFLTGGPQAVSSPYPSLITGLDLQPGASRQLTWAQAALADAEESFALARSTAARKWDAERARLELLNAGNVDIYTGDPDWDTAFSLAQKMAFNLFVGPTEHLPHLSFVLSRQPDQGHSLRGDGTDYNHLWNGQTPLEAYYLSSLVLPTAPDLAAGLVRNFLSIGTEEGFIDWKPGLAGQRSRLLATPLLASLTWRIFEVTQERAFLEETFPALLTFLQAWFTPQRDRDGDGIPEWDHPMQSGSDDHPTFSRWHEWSQGVEISAAESPSLCAFLYRECQALQQIADQLNRPETIAPLQALSDNLRAALETSWDEDRSSYYAWDRDSHYSTQGEWIGERQGSGQITIQRSFEHPVRLILQVQTGDTGSRQPQVFIHGSTASGQHRVEHITGDRFKWQTGRGALTGERVYSALEHVEIQDLGPEDVVTLHSVDYRCQEHTLLLPLWAHIPDEARAGALIEKTVTNPELYWFPYGLPTCPCPSESEQAAVCHTINLPWNTLIGEGLVHYGYRSEAAELVTRLMTTVVTNLKREGAFRRYYHAETGQGLGEKNALNGLAPLGLFLETLGVRLLSPQRVALAGFNPFPWPVTVKYRGMTILRQKDKTMVVFPDGQTVVVNDPAPRVVSLEVE